MEPRARRRPGRPAAAAAAAALATAAAVGWKSAGAWVPPQRLRATGAVAAQNAEGCAPTRFAGPALRRRPVRLLAAAPVAVVSPPALTWWGGHAVALAVYVANWLILAKVMPRGVPVREIIDKVRTPRLFVIYVVGALLELLVVYLLPLPAMALEGQWRLGWSLFAPIMIMTVVNIWLEGIFRRKRLITTVYSNTGASGVWRLLGYCAIFGRLRDAPLPWFRALSLLGIVLHIGYIVVFTPMIAAGLDLRMDDAKVLTTKDMLKNGGEQ